MGACPASPRSGHRLMESRHCCTPPPWAVDIPWRKECAMDKLPMWVRPFHEPRTICRCAPSWPPKVATGAIERCNAVRGSVFYAPAFSGTNSQHKSPACLNQREKLHVISCARVKDVAGASLDSPSWDGAGYFLGKFPSSHELNRGRKEMAYGRSVARRAE